MSGDHPSGRAVPPEGTRPPSVPGVSHREISWRAAVPRRSLRVVEPPRWLAPVVLLLLCVYLLGGLASVPYGLEEGVQTALTADVPAVATHPRDLLPEAQVPATQQAVRAAYGSLTRYAAAVGWYSAGGRAARVPVDLAATAGHAVIRVPGAHRVVASRAGPVLLALTGLLIAFGLARRLFGRPAAVLVVLLLGLHPVFLLSGRQAADGGSALAFGLAAVLIAARIAGTVARGDEPRLGPWLALVVTGGLTLAAGPTGPPYVAGAVCFCLAGLLARQLHRRREILAGRPAPAGPGGPAAWMAVTALGSVLVWVAVSPALWGWLPQRLEARQADRPALVAAGLLPDPGARGADVRMRSLEGVVSDPFLTPPRTVEVVVPNDYERSWWSGLPLAQRGSAANGSLTRVLPPIVTGVVSTLLGLVLTAAMLMGLAGLWWTSRFRAAAMTGWLLATAGWLVLSPSDEADHLLPLVVLACLLAGAAMQWGLSFVSELWRDVQEAGDARLSPDSLDFLGARDPGAHRIR